MTVFNHTTIGGALAFCLGLALWFWLIPNWVEPDPDLRLPVNLVPKLIAIGFVLCGIAGLAQGLWPSGAKPGDEVATFQASERRGFVLMIFVLLAATVGFQVLHFLMVAPALVAVSMWIYGTLRPVSLVVTSALGPVLIWYIGTEVLGRVLP